jgi:hypothetical protein
MAWHPHQEPAYCERIESTTMAIESATLQSGATYEISARVPQELANRPFKLRVMSLAEYNAMLESGGEDLKSHLDWLDAAVDDGRVHAQLAVPATWRGEQLRLCFVDAEALHSAAHRKGVGGHKIWNVN